MCSSDKTWDFNFGVFVSVKIQYKKFKFQHILHMYMPHVCVNFLCVGVLLATYQVVFCNFLDNGKCLIFILWSGEGMDGILDIVASLCY